MRQINLLVVLSLTLSLCMTATGDKHKHSSSSMRSKARKFLAFAYTGGRLTSEGHKPIAGTTIAADPKVIPMGSRVRITDAGPYSGIYTVSDKGSAIKGRKVDIFMSSRKEAIQFGKQQVNIEVLEVPKTQARAKRKPAADMVASRECRQKEPEAVIAVEPKAIIAVEPEAIIAIDEASPHNRTLVGVASASGGVGTRARRSDSGETRNSASVARVSSVERTSAN